MNKENQFELFLDKLSNIVLDLFPKEDIAEYEKEKEKSILEGNVEVA